jgi:CubicO group peptidase (beta-lactamase class C family)
MDGEVAPGFENVRDLFGQFESDAGDGGYAYAAWHEGRKVVDLWTGSTGSGPWTAESTPLWMSVTKAITALCIQMLSDRGKLDVDAPVAAYWPEFAAAGKQDITVADVMTHASGVMGSKRLTDQISLDDGTGIDRTDEIVKLLADAAPVWSPGTQVGYHTTSYGWILGEVIRRVDGRALGTFFREEIALPVGATDTYLGTPVEHHARIPTILPTMWPEVMPPEARQYMEHVLETARDAGTPAGISCLARDGVGVLDRLPEVFNNAPGRVAPLGGSNLCGPAASVAKIFAAIGEPDGIDGVRLASTESLEKFTEIRETRDDVVLHVPIARALGYWRNKVLTPRPQGFGPNDEAFGHTGVGGQVGFCDPKARVGAAYVRSHYTAFPMVPLILNGALYQSLAG